MYTSTVKCNTVSTFKKSTHFFLISLMTFIFKKIILYSKYFSDLFPHITDNFQ